MDTSRIQSAPRISVCADPPDNRDLLRWAARLSVDLTLPLLRRPAKRKQDVLLVVTASRLELRVVGGPRSIRGGRPIACELARIDGSSGPGRSLRQPLARAIGLKRRNDPRPTIVDATAGLGEDAWLLAVLGCSVLAVERHPVIATMLRDGILRAAAIEPTLSSPPLSLQSDSIHLLRRIRLHDPGRDLDLPSQIRPFLKPDVIYIDPMFPGGRKTAERKSLRVLRWLVGDDEDSKSLFHEALLLSPRRVVVKRPLRAQPLSGLEPTTTHKGKSVRYDVYARHGRQEVSATGRKKSSV